MQHLTAPPWFRRQAEARMGDGAAVAWDRPDNTHGCPTHCLRDGGHEPDCAFVASAEPMTATEVTMDHQARETAIYRKHGVCPYCKRNPLAPGQWARACLECIVRDPLLGRDDALGMLDHIKRTVYDQP